MKKIPAKSGKFFFTKMHPRKLDGFLWLIEGNWVNNLAFEVTLESRFLGALLMYASYEDANSLCCKLVSQSTIITIYIYILHI